MADELEQLLADATKKKDAPALGEKTPEQIKAEEAVKKEEEKLANIKKATAEATEQLRKARADKKAAEGKPVTEEELPEIDFNDPSAKAWDKHFNGKVNPLQDELAKEKEEIRTYALQEFLADKPNLAKDSDKLKKVIATYDRIKTASERTKEGVLIDLKKAYAAEYADEILEGRRNQEIDEARGEAIFSDIGVSRGATSIPQEKEKAPHLSTDDQAILAKWGLSPSEWVKMKQAQDKKN